MRPSTVKGKLSRSNSTNTTSSLTSSSSTSSSSIATSPSPPFSQQFLVPNPKPLEDVWKDIRLSSLNVNVNHSSTSSSNHDINLNATTFSPVIFQDFFVKESLVKVGSSTRCVPPAPSPAAAFLSLTPGAPGFNSLLFGNSSSSSDHNKFQEKQPPFVHSQYLSDSGFCGSSAGGGVKRDMDPTNDSVDDHRHKRMIKNRESACRSRARKQAYTNELELVVSNLKKENASLKAQLNQFHIDAASQQYSSKQQLKRTFTAPF